VSAGQVALSHLERLRRWRGSGVTPAAEISHYDCKDAHGKDVRVYVYAESWGRVEPSLEEKFVTEAQQLHDVSDHFSPIRLSRLRREQVQSQTTE
jgi:hypothetical protein